MNEFPGRNSVIVMDNCRIHHDGDLIAELREVYNVRVEFLPPYSPDLNPIEEAFGCIKAWIRRHSKEYEEKGYGDVDIITIACQEVTEEKARGYYQHAGYE